MDLHDWMVADLAAVRSKLFDTVVRLVPASRWHEQADGGGSTIAGLLLHVARHQDLAVNTVIRNHDPLFAAHADALGLADAGPGVALPEKEDLAVTSRVSDQALLAYVTAVFDGTQQWLDALGTLALDIEPNCDYRLTHKGGLAESDFPWLYGMWNGKALWWFVQWPVIGHAHAHAGEAISIRNRMGLSPF
ncbi:MAG: DinB family protein [Ilumatobacteraceae bacterium]